MLKAYKEKLTNLQKVLKMEEGKYTNLKKLSSDREFKLATESALSLTVTVLLEGKLEVA